MHIEFLTVSVSYRACVLPTFVALSGKKPYKIMQALERVNSISLCLKFRQFQNNSRVLNAMTIFHWADRRPDCCILRQFHIQKRWKVA